MADRSNLVPSTVTDKHGNAVIRHVRSSLPEKPYPAAFPAPRAAYDPDAQPPANKYRDLIGDMAFNEEANEKFALIDSDVLDAVTALMRRNRKWEYPTRRCMSKIFGKQNPASAMERNLRSLLVIAAMAERVQEREFVVAGTTVERALSLCDSLNYAWGDNVWSEQYKVRTEGIMIALSVSPDVSSFRKSITKDEAEWMGANVEALVPLVPHMRELGIATRTHMEPLLRIKSVALIDGAL